MNSVSVRREKITPEFREFILRRDKYICRYCGTKNPPFHLDHVYPVIKGGETSEENIVTACRHCNAVKHTKSGIYPKPIGYFERHKFYLFYRFLSPVILGCLITILFLLALSQSNFRSQEIIILLGLLLWIILAKDVKIS